MSFFSGMISFPPLDSERFSWIEGDDSPRYGFYFRRGPRRPLVGRGSVDTYALFLDRLLSGGDSRRVLPIKARSGLGSVEHYLAFQREISHVSKAPVQILYQG